MPKSEKTQFMPICVDQYCLARDRGHVRQVIEMCPTFSTYNSSSRFLIATIAT